MTAALTRDWPRLPGAACAGWPEPGLWDERKAEDGESVGEAAARHARAIEICQTCPVIAECDRSRWPDSTGVWGGHVYYPPRSRSNAQATRVAAMTARGISARRIAQELGMDVRSVTRIRARLRANATREVG